MHRVWGALVQVTAVLGIWAFSRSTLLSPCCTQVWPVSAQVIHKFVHTGAIWDWRSRRRGGQGASAGRASEACLAGYQVGVGFAADRQAGRPGPGPGPG